MSSTIVPPPHALPLGQVLYAIKDTNLICLEGAKTARFQRVSFTGSENNPKANVHGSMDLGSFDDIRSARAVSDWDGNQKVVFLSKTGLSFVGTKEESAPLTPVPAKVEDAVLVIGLDPIQTTRSWVALLVTDGAGFAVVQVDIQSGERHQPLHLPPQVRGRAVAAELVRRGSSTMLVMATIDEGSLRGHAVAWENLAPQVEAKLVTSLLLGKALTEPSAEVAVVVTSMQAGSTNQQFAVAWADTDDSCKIALLGWTASGEASVLATATPQVSFAPPAKPRNGNFTSATVPYRLAAADVLHMGTEQLVLGYTATIPGTKSGWPQREGCAALMLFTLDEAVTSVPNLKCESKYVVGIETVDETSGLLFPGMKALYSWGIKDFRIDAGIFGTCMGVQIIAVTWSFGFSVVPQSEFTLPILCGFVPVDPAVRGFPPMPAPPDGPPPPHPAGADRQALMLLPPPLQTTGGANMCGGPTSPGTPLSNTQLADFNAKPRFFAFSGLSGESVVLGAPTLTQKTSCEQILAIIQAPPFDRRISATVPSVGFSTSRGEASGCTVSSDKSWTLSDDVSVNLGLGALNLSQSTHNSYLKNFGKTTDDSASLNVQFHANFTENDYLLVYGISYNVWRYPVVRSSAKNKAGGEMLVIFPQQPTMKTSWIPAHTYAYKPTSEVGMLLSYVDRKKEAYKEENRIFSLFGISVAAKSDSSTISFDKSSSTTQTDSKHFSVLNSVSSHAGISASTELFEWLPLSFGLNLGSSHSYSDSSVETTHLTVHSSLSLTVTSGAVKDPVYEYEITPYVYQHDRLGCLMLTWEVTLTGAAWRPGFPGADAALTSPHVCLIRLVPESNNAIYQSFSRSITFVENQDGTTDIVVEIFNNSLRSALNVSCEFFLGQPDKGASGLKLPAQRLAKVNLDGELKPVERRSVTLARQKLTKPIYVSVQLFIGQIPGAVYWGVHPPEKFFG
jgi:hypothetical protein